jgi:hypothetical protein
MALITSNNEAELVRRALHRVDPEASAVIDKDCVRNEPTLYMLPGLAPADLIISAGQFAYSLVVGQLQSKIKKLEEESQATYTFRQVRKLKWQNLRCVIAWRMPEGKKADEIDMLVLLGREHLADGNVLRILYVRANRAIAKTAATTPDRPASIQLDIAVSVFSAYPSNGKPAVSELTHQVFRPLPKVVLGKPTPVCVPQDSPFATSCNMQSELFANPSPQASAFSVGLAVTETGSALGQAARARASLASLDALVKPKFEAILKQIASSESKK